MLMMMTYFVCASVRADRDVASRSQWIDQVFDEHRRTTQLAGVDSKDVVALSKHHRAVAWTGRYETVTKTHVYLIHKYFTAFSFEDVGLFKFVDNQIKSNQIKSNLLAAT